MGVIRKYLREEYEGELNLKASEKGLIIRAYYRFDGDRSKMAEALCITERILYERIISHGLEDEFLRIYNRGSFLSKTNDC